MSDHHVQNSRSKSNLRPALKLVKGVAKSAALNMIPGYPIYKAARSFAGTTTTGGQVIVDLYKQFPHKRPRGTVRSWNEALSARPLDAPPLGKIERSQVRSKQLCMMFAALALTAVVWCAATGSLLGVADGFLISFVFLLQMFQFELRLRQMETGPLDPDAPLMTPSEFLFADGFLRHLINPRIR